MMATGCFFAGGRLVDFFFGVGFVLATTAGCFLLGVFVGVLGFLEERQSAIAAIDLGDGVGKSGIVVAVGTSSGGMEVEGRGRLLGDSAYLIPATR